MMTTQGTDVRPRLLSRGEVCIALGISISHLKLLLGRRALREVRLGRRSLIAASELQRFVDELTSTPETPR
ncbi:MAG: hypothetical protein ACYCX6_00125 [Vulcanimicrobiaceae bacterium]